MSLQTRLSTAYWPPVSWGRAAWPSDTVQLEAHEHYQKASARNRCMIAGPNGPQLLSIPLEKGKHQKTPIRDVRIAYQENWQQLHWRSILTAYGNAPYFEHYGEGIQAFYGRKEVFLYDLNLKIIEFLIHQLSWKGQLAHSCEYEAMTAPLGDHSSSLRPYPQVFQEKNGFLPDLSMLDLLLCCGRQATEILLFPSNL